MKILVNGAAGHMGRILCGLIEKDAAFERAGRV